MRRRNRGATRIAEEKVTTMDLETDWGWGKTYRCSGCGERITIDIRMSFAGLDEHLANCGKVVE